MCGAFPAQDLAWLLWTERGLPSTADAMPCRDTKSTVFAALHSPLQHYNRSCMTALVRQRCVWPWYVRALAGALSIQNIVAHAALLHTATTILPLQVDGLHARGQKWLPGLLPAIKVRAGLRGVVLCCQTAYQRALTCEPNHNCPWRPAGGSQLQFLPGGSARQRPDAGCLWPPAAGPGKWEQAQQRATASACLQESVPMLRHVLGLHTSHMAWVGSRSRATFAGPLCPSHTRGPLCSWILPARRLSICSRPK